MKVVIDFLLMIIFFVGVSIFESSMLLAAILCISSLTIFALLNREYID